MAGMSLGQYYYNGKSYPTMEAAQAAVAAAAAPKPTPPASAPVTPTAMTSPSTGAYINPSTGAATPYAPSPQSMTSLYQTTTDPSGAAGTASTSTPGSISGGAFEGQQQSQLDALLHSQQMDHSAKLQADAEARRMGELTTLTKQQGGSAVAPQGGPAFDENAARTAAFARAKEEAGNTALSSLKSLEDVMSESGKTGSSVEAQGIQGILGGGASKVNDFTRTQLITDLNRAASIADQNQANAITQRGQNMAQLPSLLSLLTATGGAY